MKKSNEFFSEVIVGVFMVGVLAVLIFFTVIVSGVDVFSGRRRVERDAVFPDVGGLRKNDNIVLRGMPVGSVVGMALGDKRVKVKMMIDPSVTFRQGYLLTVMPTTMLGGNYLLVEEGSGPEVAVDAVLDGQPPSNLVKDMSEIVSELKEALEQGGIGSTLANVNTASASISNLLVRLESGEGTLGKLLAPDAKLYADLETTAANLKTVTTRLEKGEGSLGRLVADDGKVYEDLRSVAASLRDVAGRLEKGEGSIGRLLKDDGKVYDDLAASMANVRGVTEKLNNGDGSLGKLMKDDAKLYADLEASAATMRIVMERLEKGEGTLGKLSKDEALYVEVQGALKDVRQIIDNMRDTAPITTFSSILFGGL